METNCPHCGAKQSKPSNLFECGTSWCFTEYLLPDPNRREWSIGRTCLQNQLTRLQAEKDEAVRERDEELQARTNAEFELLALRDEVARLKRPVTGEEIRIDTEEANLRSELSADEGEELTVPLRVFNQLSADALALDAEWADQLTAATARADALEDAMEDVVTHRAVWEQALASKRAYAMKRGDTDNASFWNHEVGVFQRVVAALLAPAEEVRDGK